jgi:putative colanic acid biosynthesis glycosyltransferase
MKRQLFTSMSHMTIVTPSKWLADVVGQSYLKDYPVRVINNGIDLDVFKPAESDFRIRYNIPSDKPVILGVAFDWGERKGLDVFIKLAEDFGDKYQIVLVGTDDHIDAQLPENIISVHRTQNQQELAEIYSAADIFVNATREDTFPTVNIEALACGTPVITFETGGSPEIPDNSCGVVVPCDDVGAMESAICHIIEERPFTQEACRKRAEMFDMNDKFAEYVKLYQELFEEKQ